MIYLFTVAAPARSGTMWYSRLFTTHTSFCFHELTTLLEPFPANEALESWFRQRTEDHDFEQGQRRWLLECYPQYFRRLWEHATLGRHIVGNSDHFVLEWLPALWLAWPDMRFLLSTRNGINCVESAFVHQPYVPTQTIARNSSRYHTDVFFAQCCHEWRREATALTAGREWLRRRGATTVETTLERVTSDLEELVRVWNAVVGDWGSHAEHAAALKDAPVNARTNRGAIVTAEEVWARWSAIQRRTFASICGDVQRELGYDIPAPQRTVVRLARRSR